MEFKKQLDKHLNAIVSRDFESFIDTVSKDNITLIMPNGKLIIKYNDFADLHKEWFSDDDWSMSYEIINTIEKPDICSALLAVDYKDVDEKNEPVGLCYYLNLIFERNGDSWLLIHDQNTIFTRG